MKKLLLLLAAAACAMLPATAQIKIGPRLGINVNKLDFDEELISQSNTVGFTGGFTAEATIPGIGLGVDASLMYINRGNNLLYGTKTFVKTQQDYMEIPVNLKLKLSETPWFKESFFAPYVFTGPSLSVLVNDRTPDEIRDEFRQRRGDLSWNLGAGLELFDSMQLGVSYGFSIKESASFITTGLDVDHREITGKNRYWTITVSWFL